MVPHNSEHVVDAAPEPQSSSDFCVTHGTPRIVSLSRRAAALLAAVVISGCALNGGNADNAGALADIAHGRSGDEVIVEGAIIRVLGTEDGVDGAHERFVIAVKSGSDERDVLVADNISIARAAPIKVGDDVTVKGELALDPSGPVIHWTHHDPRGRHVSGFIRDRGVIYE